MISLYQEKVILYLERESNRLPALANPDFLRIYTREDLQDKERAAYSNMFLLGAMGALARTVETDKPSNVCLLMYFLSKAYVDLNDIYRGTLAS